ncbi:hypothetical protein [Bacteroides finegoldii]|uniref:hypothetical protein n=1 Tax=Bacteroides finegoldii TaxID=338188 RepID=UPI0026651FB6|nr:hypothetical protein [Bacteroides finegoldii]
MKAEKLYQCEFCGKGGFNRKKMRHHEENCSLNPASRSCQTCTYLFQELFKIDPGHTMLISTSDIYGRRPMCKAGMPISSIENSKCKVKLRSGCEFWLRKLQEGEEDIYNTHNKQNPQRQTLDDRQ